MPRARLSLLAVLLLALVLPASAGAAARPEQVTWHGNQIHLYDVQRAGFVGRRVTVAVLDGWIDRAHPDFGGRALAGADCTSGSCTPGIGTDDQCGHDHGTHVAGTVASSSYGVAPGATLLPIRVLTTDSSGDCSGTPANVAAGIRWAVSQGARVLNLSLGPDAPGQATAITSAVQEAADAGAVVVFSAGNADLPVAQSYGDNALVVAATSNTGALASYSQHGQGVSVAAPGGEPNSKGACTQATCVTSLYPGDRYAVAAGTSMAAPHVAGLAALLISAHPSWTAAQVRDRITATARPLAGAGAGRIDAAAALGVRVTRPSPTPGPTHKPVVRHHVAPAPRKKVVAAAKPSPLAVATPSPTPSATPSPMPSLSPFPSPAPVTDVVSKKDTVPVPLAAVAGTLAGLAAAGVLLLPGLTRR